VPCCRHQWLGCGLAELGNLFFYFLIYCKSLYFQVWRGPQRSHRHGPLGYRPAKVDKEFQEKKKETLILFSFQFSFIKLFLKQFKFGGYVTNRIFLKHFKFGKPAGIVSLPTLCLWARRT
jgi:hypothetical protein